MRGSRPLLASVVKDHTRVSNEWLTQRYEMSHNRSVKRLIRQGNENPKTGKSC